MESKVLPPVLGSIVKIAISAELGNDLHMSDVDFSCVIYNDAIKKGSVSFNKSELTRIDDDLYVAVVDTTIVGYGQYYVRFIAYLPDSDCPDGIRKEIVSFPTGIKVNNH